MYMLHFLRKLKETIPAPVSAIPIKPEELPEELKERWKNKTLSYHYFINYPDYNEWIVSYKTKNDRQIVFYLISDPQNKEILKAFNMTYFFQQARDSFQHIQPTHVSIDMIIGIVGESIEAFTSDFNI